MAITLRSYGRAGGGVGHPPEVAGLASPSVPIVQTRVDPTSEEFASTRSANLALLDRHEQLMAQSRAGGGDKYVARHRERDKLLVRERIELLVDRDSAFLELSPLAGWGTDFPLSGSVVTGIGVVNGVEVAISAHDPTIRGGSSNPVSLAKSLRIQDIALQNRLPLINLVESGGADLPTQADVWLPGGKWFRNLTNMSKQGIPTVALVFGSSTAGGAYVPGMCDYAVLVKDRAKVFLGGRPLVKMATGEEASEEDLGGADMHTRVSGVGDYFAVDEFDAIRIGRDIVAHLNWRKLGYGPTRPSVEPRYDAEELLGIIQVDLKRPYDMREVLARVVDDSDIDEYKQRYGTSLLTCWAHIHGYPVGILANQQGVLFSQEAQKATEFIQLCNQYDQPLLFVHNTTGYMVGTEYEQRGIIKDGAKMINAVANSEVPHLVLMAGSSYGAGNYGMGGHAYRPRFVLGWPTYKGAVMGAEQLAGVLSIVAKENAESLGVPFDEDADAQRRALIEAQITHEEQALFNSGRVRDDGLIDPRDTRSALGVLLSAVHSGRVEGTNAWGAFRM
jgi:acyl-CoA carboxylase subunit beta